jgi:hypothetical protein
MLRIAAVINATIVRFTVNTREVGLQWLLCPPCGPDRPFRYHPFLERKQNRPIRRGGRASLNTLNI